MHVFSLHSNNRKIEMYTKNIHERILILATISQMNVLKVGLSPTLQLCNVIFKKTEKSTQSHKI